jgi:hypothetical protein
MQHYCQTHSVHNNIVILLEILSSQEPSMMIYNIAYLQGSLDTISTQGF